VPAPSTLAVQFWRSSTLPSPKPSLNPANPITGLDAYLSLQADLRPSFTHPTPLGTLSISAVGTPTIRWGDGGVTRGAPGDSGAPYPQGTLIHQYIDRCVGVLGVSVAWTASWSLAGDSGSLAGMTTSAEVAIFEDTGRCVRVIGTAIDLTERKNNAEALRASQHRSEEIQAVLIPLAGPAPDFGPPPPSPSCPSTLRP